MRNDDCIKKHCKYFLQLVINKDIIEKIDGDKHLVSFTNGVFDLQKGQFRKRTEEDYINRMLPYRYSKKHNKKIDEIIKSTLFKIINC